MDKELIKIMRNAIKKGDLNLVKKIVDSKESIINEDTPFGTWLQVAAAHGKYDIVQFLIESGIDVNKYVGIADGGPIRNAAFKGHLDIVELLYQSGARLDVSAATKNPLFAAIYGGNYDVVQFLVENGIDITASYPIGQFDNVDAYEYARQYGQTEIANYLLEKLNEKTD